ncbi:MAG: hypothetical protein JXB45_07160 [Candidatus Krumholzibacteriota bacterium]|nr:hypothetical protein [Candidatus Krumholzibacteriota bacterium]
MKKRMVLLFSTIALLALISQAALGAVVTLEKSVTPMEDGKFLIKIKVRTSSSDVFGLRLIDPRASIVNIYAPRGWCVVTDGEDFLARTSQEPVKTGKPVEFIIHSSSSEVDYTWSAFGLLKQIDQVGKI